MTSFGRIWKNNGSDGKTSNSNQLDSKRNSTHEPYEQIRTQQFVDQTEIDLNQHRIQKRAEDIKQIEDSLKEIHSLMLEASVLALKQGELIDNIEINVEKAKPNVRDAVVELDKANHYHSQGSCTMM